MQISADYDGMIDIYTTMQRGSPTVEQLRDLCRLMLDLQANGHAEIGRAIRALPVAEPSPVDHEYTRMRRDLDAGVVAQQQMSTLRRAIYVDLASMMRVAQ